MAHPLLQHTFNLHITFSYKLLLPTANKKYKNVNLHISAIALKNEGKKKQHKHGCQQPYQYKKN